MIIAPNHTPEFSNDVLLSTVVALIIFTLGIIINIFIKSISEKRRLKNIKKFLSFGLSSLVDAGREQIDNLIKTSEDISNPNCYNFVIRDNVNFNTKSLSSISTIDLHKIIFRLKTKHNHSKILDDILNTIDFVDNLRKNYIANIQNYFAKYAEIEKRWNSEFEKIRKLIVDQSYKSNVEPFSKLNIEINEIFHSFRKEAPDNGMDTKKELFIDKINKACGEYLEDPLSKNFGELTLSCSNTYLLIKEQRKIYSEQMLIEKKSLELRIKSLEGIIKML